MRLRTGLFVVLLVALATTVPLAHAGPACPRADALGTARVLPVDPREFPRVGTKSFPDTLPLADKEIVLTFDDGPIPATTNKVLAALSDECVRATFFLVGQNAAAHPDLVRRMVEAGHTIGHHSFSHPNLSKMLTTSALAEIDRGIAADRAALGALAGQAFTPFFRFPFFASTPELLQVLQGRGLAVFGADFWASDWNPMTPEQQFDLVTDRLQKARKGIVLFHDIRGQTAAMMPRFLRYLRENGYRVVHIVPARSPVRS